MHYNKDNILYSVFIVIGIIICYNLFTGLSLIYAQDLPPLPDDKHQVEVIPTLDSTLTELQNEFALHGLNAGNKFATENSIFIDNDGYITVMVEMESSKLAAQFQGSGAKVLDIVDNVVKVSVHVGNLKDLALMPGVKFVYVPCPGVADQNGANRAEPGQGTTPATGTTKNQGTTGIGVDKGYQAGLNNYLYNSLYSDFNSLGLYGLNSGRYGVYNSSPFNSFALQNLYYPVETGTTSRWWPTYNSSWNWPPSYGSTTSYNSYNWLNSASQFTNNYGTTTWPNWPYRTY